MDLRFSLLPMPLMMVFTLALAHISPMLPNFFPIHAVVRLFGISALSQQITNCVQEHMDHSHLTMLLCQWLSCFQSSSWLKGLLCPSTSTPIASMCVLAKNKLAQRTERGADCSKLCRDIRERSRSLGAKPTSPRTISPPVCDDTRDFGGQCCG